MATAVRHGQRHPAAQRRRQDRRPADRGPRDGDPGRPDRPAAPAAGHRRSPRLPRPGPQGRPAPGRHPRRHRRPEQSTFLEALHALGRHPNDYSNGITADITAQMPASVAVATLLLGLLDTLEQNVDGVLRDIDTEFLHDLRVAVRRTRSAIKLLGDVLPGRPGRAVRGRVQVARRPDHADPGPRRPPARLRRDGRAAGGRVTGRPGAVPRLPGPAPRPGVPAAGRRAALGPVPGPHRPLAQGAGSRPATRAAGQAPRPHRRRPGRGPDRPRRSAGSPRRAARSPPTRPRSPCTTCASAARNCATCWSSSPRCTIRSSTARSSVT